MAGSCALATYVGLRLASAADGRVRLFDPVSLRSNLTGHNLFGLILAFALVVGLRVASRASRGDPTLPYERRVLWLASAPYVTVCAVGGIWSEAPRLVMPLVLCEFLLACRRPSTRMQQSGSAHLGRRGGSTGHER